MTRLSRVVRGMLIISDESFAILTACFLQCFEFWSGYFHLLVAPPFPGSECAPVASFCFSGQVSESFSRLAALAHPNHTFSKNSSVHVSELF